MTTRYDCCCVWFFFCSPIWYAWNILFLASEERRDYLLFCSLRRKHSKLFNILNFMMFCCFLGAGLNGGCELGEMIRCYNFATAIARWSYFVIIREHYARVRTPNPSSNVLVRFSLNLSYFIKHYAASIRFILGSIGRVWDTTRPSELSCWVWERRWCSVSEMHQWQTPHIDCLKFNILLHGTRTHKHNTILSFMSSIAKNLLFGILVSDTSKHQNGLNSARRIIKSEKHFHCCHK